MPTLAETVYWGLAGFLTMSLLRTVMKDFAPAWARRKPFSCRVCLAGWWGVLLVALPPHNGFGSGAVTLILLAAYDWAFPELPDLPPEP